MSRGRRGCNISECRFSTGKRLSHFEVLAKRWQRLVGKVRGRIVLLLCLFSNYRMSFLWLSTRAWANSRLVHGFLSSSPPTPASQSRSRFVHLTAPSPIIFADKVFSASYPRSLWSNTVDYAAGMALTGLLRKEITEEGTRSWTEASIKLRSHGPSTVMKTRFPSSGVDHAS
jgi:hypothetical protein